MKLEFELDEKIYWVEFKDTFTRRETRKWWEAQALRFPEPEKDEDGNPVPLASGAREQVLLDTEQRMLDLLREWCSTCFFEDAEGKVYKTLAEMSSEALDDFDWALVDFIFNIPLYARAKRSRLGEVVGLPSSRVMR